MTKSILLQTPHNIVFGISKRFNLINNLLIYLNYLFRHFFYLKAFQPLMVNYTNIIESFTWINLQQAGHHVLSRRRHILSLLRQDTA